MANYRMATRVGGLLFVAGTGPLADGKPTATGKLGAGVTVEAGQRAALQCVLNSLAAVRAHAGSLAAVRQVARMTVYVASAPTFTQQPLVADGATELLRALWGEAGLPARAAVGVPVLPMDIPVEVEMAVELS